MCVVGQSVCSERPLDALLGKAMVLMKQQKMSKALDCIDECIVIHEWYRPALITKAHILMVMGDWSQALDLAERAIDKSKGRDIDGLIIASLFYLVRAGNAAEVCGHVFIVHNHL